MSHILIGRCRQTYIQPDCIQRSCLNLAKVVIFCQDQANQPREGFFLSSFSFGSFCSTLFVFVKDQNKRKSKNNTEKKLSSSYKKVWQNLEVCWFEGFRPAKESVLCEDAFSVRVRRESESDWESQEGSLGAARVSECTECYSVPVYIVYFVLVY